MSQSKKNNILVGDIGNTETKIFFRNNKIEKKIALKSNEMIYSKIKSKVLFLKKFNIEDKAVFCSVVPSNFRIIKKVFERELKIKRPNDILFKQYKICGILQETIFYKNLKYLLVGVGLNLLKSPKFKNYKTTSVYEIINTKVNRIRILNEIKSNYESI